MKRGFNLVEVMICVVIVGLLLCMAIPAFQAITRGDTISQEQYAVWIKLNPGKPLTFEEWQTAKRAGYLGK